MRVRGYFYQVFALQCLVLDTVKNDSFYFWAAIVFACVAACCFVFRKEEA